MRTVATVIRSSAVSLRKRTSTRQPTWGVVEFFPRQGEWTEDDYLALPDSELRFEWVDGFLDFLPMPTKSHELIEQFIFLALFSFVTEHRLGEVYRSGRRLKLNETQIRIPDILFVPFSKVKPGDEEYCSGADVVVEIVSGGARDRERDLDEKLKDYAAAGIPEYWIVDPKAKTISVLRLSRGRYGVRKAFKAGEIARSNVLKGFELDVGQALTGFKFPRA